MTLFNADHFPKVPCPNTIMLGLELQYKYLEKKQMFSPPQTSFNLHVPIFHMSFSSQKKIVEMLKPLPVSKFHHLEVQ